MNRTPSAPGRRIRVEASNDSRSIASSAARSVSASSRVFRPASAGASRRSADAGTARPANARSSRRGAAEAADAGPQRVAGTAETAREAGSSHRTDAWSTRSTRSPRASRDTQSARSAKSTRGARGPRNAAPAAEAKPGKSRYIPGLDGLRAFAVLAVIAYHMNLPWALGGLLGVTVFFVLSGYLITSLLLIEFESTGRIDLPQFWLRRVRRLVPAIVFVIICTAVLCTIFDHSLLTKMRPDVLPSLLFFNNWWQIFNGISYFDALGAPSPLTHFWSLAIEEQFYLVWPVLLFIALKLGVRKSILRNATLVLAAASAIDMALLYDPLADASRVYYGTDTRAFSLLLGACLAFVWPSSQLGAKSSAELDSRARLLLDGAGAVAFVGLVLMVVFADGFSPFLYRGGLVLCSLLTAVVIAVVVHPASIFGRVAGIAPLVWIGKRSYGIYLWHFPLLLLMNPRNFIGETPWWMLLVQLVVIFACAAFSYRFVENPIRHGAIGQFLQRMAAGEFALSEWLQRHIVPSVGAALLVLVAAGGLAFVPNTAAIGGADLLKQEGSQTAGPAALMQNGEGSGQGSSEEDKLDVLMIGDSVSVRAIPYFQERFPYGAIDAAVSRQLYVGQEVFNYYDSQGIVGKVVVFSLGTNGVVTDDQLEDLIETVGSDREIWFINTRSPQSWMQTTNDALQRAAEEHGNVHLIDWYSASASHSDYFDGDGTHLNELGAETYVQMIYDAVKDHLPERKEGSEAVKVKSPAEQARDNALDVVEFIPAAVAGAIMQPQPQTQE